MKRVERRLSKRVNLRIPLQFRPISDPATPEQKAESLNLSAHGVYFVTGFPPLVGTLLELSLRMPAEVTGKVVAELRCTARVIHIQAGVLGDNRSGVGVHIERHEMVAAAERSAS